MSEPGRAGLGALLARHPIGDRIARIGGGLAVIGGVVLLVAGGRNANGVAGPALVVAVGGTVAVLAIVLRRGRQTILLGLAGGVVAVLVVEGVPVVRYSADLDLFGGLVGALARVVAIAGAGGLLVGIARRPPSSESTDSAAESGDASRSIDRLSARLVLAGAVLLVVGWLALGGIGIGFAPRVIDGLAIVAASVAAAAALSRGPAERGPLGVGLRVAPLVLAAAAALVTFGSLLAVDGRLGELLRSGPLSVVAYVLYLTSSLPTVAAMALVVRPWLRQTVSRSNASR